MKQFLPLLIIGAGALASPLPCVAQNVTGYGTMADPFLFLVREPAVHDDLGLTPEQGRRLVEINHSFDGLLLATRNMPAEKGEAKIAEIMTATRNQAAKLLSTQQQERLRQIAYRLRGISCVLMPHAAEQLRLTSQQKAEIEAIVKETREQVNELQSGTYQGEEAHRKSQDAITAARKKEQQAILDLLDNTQKQRLMALVGGSFAPGRLGHVSFKAPELSTDDEWINSKPLQLADLRGKVVALHFWPFG